MALNRLRLNPAKSEFMWCATSRRLHHIDDFVFDLPDGAVKTSTSVRNLGAYLDQALTLHEHVARPVSACFNQLRRIRSIRRSIPTSTATQFVISFIILRVDYCNSLLSGAPACLTDRVQSVLNAAARPFHGRGRYDRVTDLIRDRLHWHPCANGYVSGAICWHTKVSMVSSHPTSPITTSGRTRPRTDNLYERQHPPTRDNLIGQDTKTQFGERSFAVAGKKIWNSLPNNVKNAESVETCKSRLKTHLFKLAYDV